MTDPGPGAPASPSGEPAGRRVVNPQQVRDHARTINDASVAAIQQLAIVWETRINMALAADDADALHDALRSAMPVAFTDTNCSCGGGGTAYLG